MAKNKWSVCLWIVPMTALCLHAKDLEMRKKTGPLEVLLRIDKNPPIQGNNNIEIVLTDYDGARVTDADILVNYYMPPMPRMAPMNYRTEAKLKGEKYKAKMKLIMAGPWIIAVKISRDGKKMTARFNIDAR